MDNTSKHDPLDQYADEENELLEEEIVDREIGAGEVQAAEEAAVNTDNESAMEATEHTAVSEAELELEQEVAQLDEEIKEEEAGRKHKNRESTSEKAKKAATRQSTSEKAKLSQAEKQRQLDPLRLRGKKYRAKVALIDKNQTYPIEEAVELVKQTATAQFDSAVEFHAKVKSDGVRGTVSLPHGSGKTRKVAVATDETIEAIANGKLDFDVLIATPAQMPKLAKYAKVLGPKGLMPSPKAGTVTDDLEKAQTEISGGRVEYRADKNGVVHLGIGRVSFDSAKLVENFRAIEQILISSKIQSISLASTMGPGVRVSLTK